MNTVLHIDNSLVFTKIIKSIFEEYNCTYLNAGNINAAFEILKNQKIDLIMTAMELGELGGIDLVKKLNDSIYKNIPVVTITSNDSLDLRKEMFSLGVIDYIPKNIEEERLKNYVEKIIKEDISYKELKDMKVAVLDDSNVELRMIRAVFELYEINNVDYYTHPNDLLKSETEYQVYLIDIILPDHSGDQIIYDLRKKFNKSIIIAISGIDHYKTISNIFSSGADDYIMKPFNKSILIARLKAHVRTLLLLQEIEEKNRELEEMVIKDSLTDLCNHNYIYERLDYETKKAKRYKSKLSVVMFDIDYFKHINDTYGHQVGDEVLIAVSSLMKSNFREVDIIGRYGGEEFVVIFPETALEDAYVAADKIRSLVENLKFDQKDLQVKISGGVVEYNCDDPLELINKVDSLLYNAKNSGRNKIVKQQ